MHMIGLIRTIVLMLLSVCATAVAFAQDAEEMARKLQDPLASIKALMTDNDVLFKTGQDKTSYSFQLQPVYAVPFEERGFNFVTRGIIPYLGIAPQGQRPNLGEPLPPGDSRTWGLSDMTLQFFFSPRTDNPWKWGLGPMFSLKTRTESKLSGAGWGAGPVAVLVGNLSAQVSTAFVAGHLWGDENSFSTSILQPMVFYNLAGLPGAAISYSNTIAYDWNTSSGNSWTVPLGASISRTFALKGGTGLDMSLGYYYNVEKPQGAADSALKWAVSLIFP